MQRTQRERITRTYCDTCGDICKASIAHMDGKDLCEKQTCRQPWHNALRMNIVISAIKKQPYFRSNHNECKETI